MKLRSLRPYVVSLEFFTTSPSSCRAHTGSGPTANGDGGMFPAWMAVTSGQLGRHWYRCGEEVGDRG